MGGQGSGMKPTLCSHDVLGKKLCPMCQKEWNDKCRKVNHSNKHQIMHPEQHSKSVQEWKLNNPKKSKIHNLVVHHPDCYPLDDKCVFCGTTEHLEHGHLDYEDDGVNYVTVCHRCNCYMNVD